MLKKTQILVLTAIACASSAVMAQSSLQLYGNLDMSLGNTKTDSTGLSLAGGNVVISRAGSTSTTGVNSGIMSDSYIGFKGTEDLGGGMEAQFTLESRIDGDTGATSGNLSQVSAIGRTGAVATILGGGVNSTTLALANSAAAATWNTRDEGGFWAKNAYVGIKTNYGLFRLGQMENLGYLSAVKYNPFGSGSINPTTRVFYGTDYYARSWSNTIAYYLRTEGWLVGVQHAPKNDTTAAIAAGNQGGAKTTATVSYMGGPLNVSLGVESNKDNISYAGEAKSWALHASYDFGVVKAYAEYGAGKLDATAATSPDVKSTGLQLGASVPMGANGSFLASYAAGKQKAENGALAALGAPQGTTFREVTVYAIGYTHNLSKRTSIYGAYSSEEDFYPVAGMTNLKIETKQLSVGVRHSF
jgi:predicted porin